MMRGKLALGLDIGTTGVRLIQLKATKRKGELVYSLENFGMKPLPPQTIVDGSLLDSALITEAIQDLAGELNIKHKEVALCINGHSVIIKKIAMPSMTPEELEEAIQWEAEQHVPFDIQDVNIDTQIVNADPNDPAGQMDVLLVAVKKDIVNDYAMAVSEAGLTPVVADIGAFAVQNCFLANYEVSPTSTYILINAGAALINISIVVGGVTTFTRDISIGGNQFTEEIQKQLSISYDEAEALKVGGEYSATDTVVPQEIERIMTQAADGLGGEIQRSLDFYAGTTGDAQFHKVFLAGGSARAPALFRTIESRVGVPVEILNPFRRIEIDNHKFDPLFITEVAPQAAVAVGLALRKPNDKYS